jgi:hypothetical protein
MRDLFLAVACFVSGNAWAADEVLAHGVSDPARIAIDDRYVYWVGLDNVGLVERGLKTGGAIENLTAVGAHVQDLEVGAGMLFISTPRALTVVDLATGSATTHADLPAWDLEVDGDQLYFVGRVGQASWVRRMPIGGSSADVTDIVRTESTNAKLGVDSIALFWSDYESGSSQVFRVPKRGGVQTTLFNEQAAYGQPYDIVVRNGDLVFRDGPYLYDFSLADTQIESLITDGSREIHAMTADDRAVYWGNGAGAIRKYSFGSNSSTTIAWDQANPADVAVDGTHVYWCNRWEGTIRRAAK